MVALLSGPYFLGWITYGAVRWPWTLPSDGGASFLAGFVAALTMAVASFGLQWVQVAAAMSAESAPS